MKKLSKNLNILNQKTWNMSERKLDILTVTTGLLAT